jgi:hypothetical protein
MDLYWAMEVLVKGDMGKRFINLQDAIDWRNAMTRESAKKSWETRKKRSEAGFKSWKTRRRRIAANKAWETRRAKSV